MLLCHSQRQLMHIAYRQRQANWRSMNYVHSIKSLFVERKWCFNQEKLLLNIINSSAYFVHIWFQLTTSTCFVYFFFDRNNKIDTKDSHVWVGMTIFSFSRFWPVIYTNYLRCKLNNSDVSCVKSWASPFFSSVKSHSITPRKPWLLCVDSLLLLKENDP